MKVKTQPIHPVIVDGIGGRKGGEEEAADRAGEDRLVEDEVAVVAAVRLRARDGANRFAMVGEGQSPLFPELELAPVKARTKRT